MLTEEKDILVCKDFSIKLGCRSRQVYYFIVETELERFRSMSLEEIGDWVKIKFSLSDAQMGDIGKACSVNAAIAFKEFALEYE